MLVNNKYPKICYRCGEPKSSFKDGREIFLRCKCEWEKSFICKILKTIHPSFLKPIVKRMIDWNPEIFSENNSGKFPTFIKSQKVVAINRIYDFCYKDVGNGKISALFQSLNEGRSLFIRGPKGSGRGLLSAMIKVAAAMKDINTTLLPGEFDVFKNDLFESKAMGREGIEAKSLVMERYGDASLLVLENCRAESIIKFSGEEVPSKSKVSNEIDTFFAKKMITQNATVITSDDFIGQIGYTLGDRLLEILGSDKTSLILMFSPDESDELLSSLILKHSEMVDSLAVLGGIKSSAKDKKNILEKRGEEETLAMIEEALYFEEAFPNIPNPRGIKIKDTLEMFPDKYSPKILSLYASFKEKILEKGMVYKEGIKVAQIQGSKCCKILSSKMTQKELLETGRMMSLATGDKLRLEQLIEKSKQLQKEMSGI